MPPQDQFVTFNPKTLEATGFVQYMKQNLDYMCVSIIQRDSAGNVVAAADGSHWDDELQTLVENKGARTSDNEDQPTWRMKLKPVTGTGQFNVAPGGATPTRVEGLAVYSFRDNPALSGGWMTPEVKIIDKPADEAAETEEPVAAEAAVVGGT